MGFPLEKAAEIFFLFKLELVLLNSTLLRAVLTFSINYSFDIVQRNPILIIIVK